MTGTMIEMTLRYLFESTRYSNLILIVSDRREGSEAEGTQFKLIFTV